MSLVELALKDVPLETREAFLLYHKENPEIWKAIEETTLQVIKEGKKIGIMTVIGKVRWDFEIARNGEYKVNNNYAPYFARIFNAKYHTDFFEVRKVSGLKEAA